MRRFFLIGTTAVALIAGTGWAFAQSFSFTPEHGRMISEHAGSQHYNSVRDPNIHANVGATLPGSVDLHPLPGGIGHPQAQQYGYAVVNDSPVVVEHSSRRVVHSFGH